MIQKSLGAVTQLTKLRISINQIRSRFAAEMSTSFDQLTANILDTVLPSQPGITSMSISLFLIPLTGRPL